MTSDPGDARAFLAVCEAPREKVHMQAFNVGDTAENYRVIEIARLVEEVVPGARIRFAPNAGPDPRCPLNVRSTGRQVEPELALVPVLGNDQTAAAAVLRRCA